MSEEPQTAEDFERIADEKAKQKAEGWNAYVEQYYRRAIQEGSVSAISKLADYYYLGDGNDNKKAAVLYLEAAKAKGDDCEREQGDHPCPYQSVPVEQHGAKPSLFIEINMSGIDPRINRHITSIIL